MNWEALGAIGETIGAVAVILTLVYLALQIRQNSRSLRLAAAHGWKSDTQDLRLTVAKDPEMTRILREGVQDASSLDENDRVRFSMTLAAIFDHGQFAFERREEGLLDWDAQERFIRTYLAQPGTQEWWKSGRAIFNDSFVKYVEEQLIPSSEGSRPYWAQLSGARDNATDRR
jgi:hypothetical protein